MGCRLGAATAGAPLDMLLTEPCARPRPRLLPMRLQDATFTAIPPEWGLTVADPKADPVKYTLATGIPAKAVPPAAVGKQVIEIVTMNLDGQDSDKASATL